MKIIIALLIFSLVVLFHELGHFLLAKRAGVTVVEFSLGMGPRIVSTVWGDTRYSVKAFPLGGSCVMQDEDGEGDGEGSFNNASVWSKISIVAAGPVFNFILAYILAVIIVAGVGYDPAQVMEVEEGSPVAQAGLQEGDVITSFQGYQIDLGKDLYAYNFLEPVRSGEPVTLTYKRDGKEREITFQPEDYVRYLMGVTFRENSLEVGALEPGYPAQQAGIRQGDLITGINGTVFGSVEDYRAYIQEHPLTQEAVTVTYVRDGLEYESELLPQESRTPLLGFGYNVGCVKTEGFQIFRCAALEIKYMVRTTMMGLKQLVTGELGLDSLSGPVGVVDVIGDTYEASKSEGMWMVLMNMLNMALLLSANLGVMNLLPIPALDGGRLVFLLVEAVRRKPVNRQIESAVHFTGLMLLMLLMVIVMYKDIMKII